MAVPNFYQTVVDLANKYPTEFKAAHTGSAKTEVFIRLVAFELSKLDPRFGLNGKRGDYNVISQDAINFIGEGVGHDPRTGRSVTVIDVIGGAGGNSPTPTWQVFNDPNIHAGPGGWIQAQPLAGYHDVTPPVTPPVEPPPVTPSIPPELKEAVDALRSSVEANTNAVLKLTTMLENGFKIQAKAGWPIGEVSGDVTPR